MIKNGISIQFSSQNSSQIFSIELPPRTFSHSRCQGVPTADGVNAADVEGDWSLVEYHTSFGGKPFPPHSPYLCPESRVVITTDGAAKMNVSQAKQYLTRKSAICNLTPLKHV